MTTTTIEPGSPVQIVLQFLQANPDEVLDRTAAAAKLSVALGAVDRVLQPAVDAGLVTVANSGEYGRVWRAGRLLKGWKAESGAGAASTKSTSNEGQPRPAAGRGGKRQRLPPLDLSKLQVRTGQPLPQTAMCRPGCTLHDSVFDKLDVDGKSVEGIPRQYMGSVSKAMQTYLKHRPQLAASSALLLRATGPDTFGIWRTAKKSKAV